MKTNPNEKQKGRGRPRKSLPCAISDDINNLEKNSTQPRQRVKAMGLLLDVKTRWNSAYLMLQRFYDLRFL